MAKQKVLIVDDAQELGRLLQASLMTLDASLSIKVIPSAEEVLMDPRSSELDLLVADVRLPGISGLELVKRMRTRNTKTRIIVVSGLQDDRLPQKAKDAGANYFFRKPVSMSDFLDAASLCLGITVTKPAGQAEFASALSDERLEDRLSHLRQMLDARAVALVNNRGQLILQAGELPLKDFETTWMPLVLSMANSAEKLSHLLEQPKPESVIGLRGQQYDLVLAPVGNFVLVAVLPAGRYTVRLSISLGEVLASVADLTAHVMASTQQETSPAEIENLPISEALPPSMGEPVKEAEQEPVGPPLEEFAQVFEEHVTQIKKDEADAFWDKAGKPKTGSLNKADVITYDEAQKLGLTPHENGEGKS